MGARLKGTVPSWNKPAVASSLFTSLSALVLSEESDITDKQDKIAKESYIVPAIYFYLSVMTTCHAVSLEKYKELKKENDKKGPKAAWMYPPVPTKAQLEDSIKSWRKLSKITIATVGGVNLYSLSRIYDVASEQSTKNIALASAILTIATTVYDYDNVFSNKPPPWADFDIVTTEIGNSLVPSVRYTYNF
ncbi:hypothetical protein [Halobacteriovorax sp. YZS-3-1]